MHRFFQLQVMSATDSLNPFALARDLSVFTSLSTFNLLHHRGDNLTLSVDNLHTAWVSLARSRSQSLTLRNGNGTTMISWKILTALLAATGSQHQQPAHPLNLNGDKPGGAAKTAAHVLTTYKVCLSPGCIADGAGRTLEKLQALAPPDIVIKEGSCTSLCGNGPVVFGENNSKHRKVSGNKILALLFPDDSAGSPSQALLEGYDLVLQADDDFGKKNYAAAVVLYEKALSIAFGPAMDLQTARDHMQRDDAAVSTTATKPPVGLQWLIRARCNEATAKLELGDVGGALLAANGACNISRNTSVEAFQVLALIYERKKDAMGELQALQNMFALPVVESKLPFSSQNKRREFGFRLAKLERDVAQPKN